MIADLATPDGPASAVEATVAALGGLDLLVVNTGGPPGGTFDTLGEAEWEAAIAGTLQSTLRLIRASLPHLRSGRDPSILIVLSSSVREPIPALTTSNVLRPGLAGLVKTLTAEIAPIRINGLAPGRIATDRIAFLDGKRAEAAGVTAEEIAEPDAGEHPAGSLRRAGRDRAGGGVPAVARGVLRYGGHRSRGRRDGTGAAVGRPRATRPQPPANGRAAGGAKVGLEPRCGSGGRRRQRSTIGRTSSTMRPSAPKASSTASVGPLSSRLHQGSTWRPSA